ncbi:cytidine deaminase [Pseudomonas sp. PDM26]|uniref:cytidine deaminase n=1 Tax=Pseudomonas sp. PDM26 TaxID=2854766 RepID=UPI00210E7D62|nr:cytidine deaminase [Pseudomonas sp. PDM26]
MRFDGSIDELKKKLEPISSTGEWREINKNQYQFKTKSKGSLNWYLSTGGIHFQGKAHSAQKLKMLVEPLLNTETRANLLAEDISKSTQNIVEDLSTEDFSENTYFIDGTYSDSELIIGLVGTIGTDLPEVSKLISDRLKTFKYETRIIKISTDIIANIGDPSKSTHEFDRITSYMEEGNRLRKESQDNSILALGAAAQINKTRGKQEPLRRSAFIINSLKSPAEVQKLRKIYSDGFFLIGVHADHTRRHEFLTKDKSMTQEQASRLIERDADEREEYGQHTRDTYHLSDFFIDYNGNSDSLKKQIWRILDLLFGKPYITPTFDEYAMFMAFSASLRSADLSRQVGAVLTKNRCIISTGANDVPKAHGGLYWPDLDEKTHEIADVADGRDYMKGEDSNAIQKN